MSDLTANSHATLRGDDPTFPAHLTAARAVFTYLRSSIEFKRVLYHCDYVGLNIERAMWGYDIEKLIAKGGSIDDIAGRAGEIIVQRLRQYREDNEDFRNAYDKSQSTFLADAGIPKEIADIVKASLTHCPPRAG
jgi:hypothetical protein